MHPLQPNSGRPNAMPIPQRSTVAPILLPNRTYSYGNNFAPLNFFGPPIVQSQFFPMIITARPQPIRPLLPITPTTSGMSSSFSGYFPTRFSEPVRLHTSVGDKSVNGGVGRQRWLNETGSNRKNSSQNNFCHGKEIYRNESDDARKGTDVTNHSSDPTDSILFGEAIDISDKELMLTDEDESEKNSKCEREKWKVAKKRRKRKRKCSSSSDSDFDADGTDKNDVPRWQKLTADDFADTVLSDTSEELDETFQQTVTSADYLIETIPAPNYYTRNDNGDHYGTSDLQVLHNRFQTEVLDEITLKRKSQPKSEPPEALAFHESCKCGHQSDSESELESESDENECKVSDSSDENVDYVKMSESKRHNTLAGREVERKRNHPAVLHVDVCFNETGQMNDGPECRCSWAAKQSGLRHNKYSGESVIRRCDWNSSNANRLFHYVLLVNPNPKSIARRSTRIIHDDQIYELEGFSIFFHRRLPENFPQTSLSKWSSEYSISFIEEKMPENFTIEDLELFHEYLFVDVMEMYDLKRFPDDDDTGCPFYHCMPRFVYEYSDGNKKLLAMSVVLNDIVGSYRSLVTESEAYSLHEDPILFRQFADSRRGSLVLNASKRPCTIRADLIENAEFLPDNPDSIFPLITHFGIRPSSHTYNFNSEYQKLSKEYLKMRKMLAIKSRISAEERGKLAQKASKLKELRNDIQLKRDFVMSVSSSGFYQTGLFSDIIQHAMLLILACSHARFHWFLQVYEEERIHYVFKDRSLLELALTHPSYRINYGTNSDHARNTLNNCGIRPLKQRMQDRSVQQQLSAKKRGFNTLMEIMSKLGSKKVEQSPLNHNERLEFLGDAVIEFITTIHLFFMFDELDEGGLATYRSTMVQNKNLAILAKKIGLDEFMLYAHGPDLCHESDLRHAMANAFEAMMAAIFLDAGIDECDKIFGNAMFGGNDTLLSVWFNLEEHPLKRDNPYGDRHLIKDVSALQLLTELEKSIGVSFKHIRVLAKAFTRRNIGFNNLTLGHNQRLEFLGDTILQLITTDYLYKHFPYHHEGHLSILRTCLVSNKTQSVICDDIGMTRYLVTPKALQKNGKPVMRVKDKADLVEAFLGALYVDRGLKYCKVFCRVCFFPRLKYFITSQKWNDPKSQLQQCCLTLRQLDGSEPDIPEYRTIAVEGPTNTRVYKVAVYFRRKRLAVGSGHTMQIAQMHAAENALIQRADLFPTLSAVTNSKSAKKRRRNNDQRKQTSHSRCQVSASDLSSSDANVQSLSKSKVQSLLDLRFDLQGHLL